MAGAADLGAARRERPQAPRRRSVAGEDERRLGLIELAGDVGEDLVAESVAAVDDGERVAGQRGVGEHVDECEAQCGHRLPSCSTPAHSATAIRSASVQLSLKLDAHRLIMLKAVVDHGSMSNAALELGFSTSAVSQQVAALELTAGVPLLTRHARGVTPTAAGAVLVRHAAALSERLDAASEELEDLIGAAGGRCAPGSSQRGPALLPDALRRFTTAFAGVTAEIVECDADDGAQRVADGQLDLAVVFGIEPGRLDLTTLGVDRYRVVLPAGHPAAAGPVTDAAELRDERWILPRGPACASLVADACARAGFEPDVVIAADDHAAARRLVESGIGITVAPELLGWADDAHTVVRDLRPAPARGSRSPSLARTGIRLPHSGSAMRCWRQAARSHPSVSSLDQGSMRASHVRRIVSRCAASAGSSMASRRCSLAM